MRPDHPAHHEVRTNTRGARYCRACWRGEDDLDEVAITRAVQGDRTAPLTPAEREDAVALLRDQGLLHREIAVQLGITPRTVERHLALRRARSAA
jgi:DNA-binding NarL/FixJ family response regulator